MSKGRWLIRRVAIGLLFVSPPTYSADVTAGMAEVNGTRLYYETAGQGSPVVLIHGGLLNNAEWDAQFRTFAEHYYVMRYDVCGFGKSATRSRASE